MQFLLICYFNKKAYFLTWISRRFSIFLHIRLVLVWHPHGKSSRRLAIQSKKVRGSRELIQSSNGEGKVVILTILLQKSKRSFSKHKILNSYNQKIEKFNGKDHFWKPANITTALMMRSMNHKP